MDGQGLQKQGIRLQYKGMKTSQECSRRLCSLLEREYETQAEGIFRQVTALAAYYPIRGEANLLPFLQKWLEEGHILLLPCFDESSGQYSLAEIGGLDDQWLIPGKCGIPEPKASCPRHVPPFRDTPQLWLVPGLAFDRKGVRLGRGGGWYDRLLKYTRAPKIGVCPKERLAPNLPVEEHDIRMDYLLSENGILPIPSERPSKTS